MKKKRTIIIKNQRLRNIRKSFRDLIFYAKHEEVKKIHEEKRIIINQDPNSKNEILNKKYKELSDERSKLESAWKKSICVCPVCRSMEKDMSYIPQKKEWFCVDCVKDFDPDVALALRKKIKMTREQIRQFLSELAHMDGCGGKEFHYAKAVLYGMNISPSQQDLFLELCKFHGGNCDCEILMNARPYLLKYNLCLYFSYVAC